jgi:hypothetical protein
MHGKRAVVLTEERCLSSSSFSSWSVRSFLLLIKYKGDKLIRSSSPFFLSLSFFSTLPSTDEISWSSSLLTFLLFCSALTYSNKQSTQFVQSMRTSLKGTHLLSNARKLLTSQIYSNSLSYYRTLMAIGEAKLASKTDIESTDIIKRL